MDLVRALDLELNPGSGVVVIGDKQYDYLSDDGFDDIPRLAVVAGESGYGSGTRSFSILGYPRYIGRVQAITLYIEIFQILCGLMK